MNDCKKSPLHMESEPRQLVEFDSPVPVPVPVPRVAKGTAAVAMSGGLDSSVVAWLLAQGDEPAIGLSMLLWDESMEHRNGRCCGALDLGDAKRVAEQAGMPHYTLRMDQEFRELVVDPFVNDYLEGRTPSPCVRCNTWVKFDLLVDRAMALGASYIATGHYARILFNEKTQEYELHRAVDESKDQTYFLFELTQEQLRYSRFPLGEMTKDAVRGLAREAGLVVAEKGESMDVCFVTNGVREFVEGQVAAHPDSYSDAMPENGVSGAKVVSVDGEELGEVGPYYRYTVGQRKGLGISSSRRLYIVGLDPKENLITVGDRADLLAEGLLGERLHWIGSQPPLTPRPDGFPGIAVTVRIRSRQQSVGAWVVPLQDGHVRVKFDEPQSAVAPGQAAVFYRGTHVLGGCWIEAAD